MTDNPKSRRRLRYAVEEYFRQRSSPRFVLGIVLLITGLAGFGISFGLLRAGMGTCGCAIPSR
jgi:hypothetical protein